MPSLASFVTRSDAAKKIFFPIVSQIGLNYHHNSLSKHGDDDFKTKAGDRMPYFLVDGETVYNRLRALKFHLLFFCGEKNSDLNLQQEIKTEYGEWLEFQFLTLSPQVEEIFGSDRSFMVLLRPDNYIGLLSVDLYLEDLQSYFRSNKLISCDRILRSRENGNIYTEQ